MRKSEGSGHTLLIEFYLSVNCEKSENVKKSINVLFNKRKTRAESVNAVKRDLFDCQGYPFKLSSCYK